SNKSHLYYFISDRTSLILRDIRTAGMVTTSDPMRCYENRLSIECLDPPKKRITHMHPDYDDVIKAIERLPKSSSVKISVLGKSVQQRDIPCVQFTHSDVADEVKQRTLIIASQHGSEERRVGKECRSRWSPYH